MSRSLSINLYLRPFSIAIYEKFSLYVCTYSELCLLFQTVLDLWPVLVLQVFSNEILRKASFNLSYYFSCFYLVCKLYKSGLYIITYFGHRQCFIRRFLDFSFLAFNFYKNLKSNHHLLCLAIFPDLEILQF